MSRKFKYFGRRLLNNNITPLSIKKNISEILENTAEQDHVTIEIENAKDLVGNDLNKHILVINLLTLIFHSLSIISVFREVVIIRSIIYSLIYLFFIFDNISLITLTPVLFLLIFTVVILKISFRTNMDGLNKSLDNIGNVDILRSSDKR